MSAKEKYLRRLLQEAEFYLYNIDGDDPKDPVGDALKAGSGTHLIDATLRSAAASEAKDDQAEEGKEHGVSF